MNLTLEEKKDFMKKAAFAADNSSCGYKIGCIGVVEYKAISKNELPNEFKVKNYCLYLKTWNETLPGEIYCQNGFCIRQEENLKGRDFQKVCSIHAEVNLIAKCARYGIPTNDMAIFITNSPCYICAKSIIQAGVSELYYLAEHTDTMGLELLKKNSIKVEKLEVEI